MSEPIKIAVLLTRCGCTREMTLDLGPAPLILHVALNMRLWDYTKLIETPEAPPPVRSFRLAIYGHADERNCKEPPEKIHILYEEM